MMPDPKMSDIDFDDLAFGLHLKHEAGLTPALVRRGDRTQHWWELLDVRNRCAAGDFSELPNLVESMKGHEDELYWTAVGNLVACAGSWATITRFVDDMRSRISHPAVGGHSASILGMSCNLNAVEPLLQLHNRFNDEDDDAALIPRELSYLLEEDNGPIWDRALWTKQSTTGSDGGVGGADQRDPLPEMARAKRQSLELGLGASGGCIFEGLSYDVVTIAKRLLSRLDSDASIYEQEERVSREVIAFEAATGIDCSSFWDGSYRLRPLTAAAAVEDFLDSPVVRRFEPGRRYFFGHPIPD
jgi:hypothetical protein